MINEYYDIVMDYYTQQYVIVNKNLFSARLRYLSKK